MRLRASVSFFNPALVYRCQWLLQRSGIMGFCSTVFSYQAENDGKFSVYFLDAGQSDALLAGKQKKEMTWDFTGPQFQFFFFGSVEMLKIL